MFEFARRAGVIGILLLLVGLSQSASAFVPFKIEDIRVEGLRRIAPGTVFTYLPVRVGQLMDGSVAADSVRTLYETGFFKDIRLEREGGVLVVILSERPAIASIDFSGNEEIETDALLEALKARGFAVGRVFDRSILEKIERELRNQYFARGKYSVRIKATLTPLERNRVAVAVDVSEGKVARIKSINIVGNAAFTDEELLSDFDLANTSWFEFWKDGEKYDKQRLQGDIERLKARYLDAGFLKFRVKSSEVSISPDLRDIYVTVNIDEGDQYTLKEIKLAGELKVPATRLFPHFSVVQGELLSQREVVKTANAISDELGNAGYAFANVNPVPELDEENKQVSLTFYVDPGKRVQVRRIVTRGNTKTSDQVVRREMRQMESAWYDAAKIERSKQRLNLLGFFQSVDVKTVPVPNSVDQVDLVYQVEEKPTGNLLAGVGYGQTGGISFNASISQDNFFGTGKRVSAGFNTSSVNTLYKFDYTDPYYTIDGISRGFGFGYRKTDAGQANLADYTTDEGFGRVSFGIPVNETDRITSSFEVQNLSLNLGSTASTEITDFVTAHGDSYLDFILSLGWSRDSRNSVIFPSSGTYQSIDVDVSLPGSDLTYVRYTYEHKYLHPLPKHYVLSLKGQVGAGAGYGDVNVLPFFRNFFAGGVTSVRGFKGNTIGPRDSNNEPLGGQLKVVGNAELIAPSPFRDYKDEVRLSAFVDAGSVFSSGKSANASEIRVSTGVGLRWFTPVGPMSFAYSVPLRDQPDDVTEAFQFTLGTDF